MVGVRVRVRQLPPDPAWKDSGVTNAYENQEAKCLFREMDAEQEGYLVPTHWDLEVGSVLVARDDGKYITPQQVEALCYYSGQHTTDRFHSVVERMNATGSNKEKMKLAALFTPSQFRHFFGSFKAKKMEEGASWVTAELPV